MTADDFFLIFGAQALPGIHIVNVFLHKGIAAAGKFRIFVADNRIIFAFILKFGFSVPSTKPIIARPSI